MSRSARLCILLALLLGVLAPAAASARASITHAGAREALQAARVALNPADTLAARVGGSLGTPDATAALRDLAVAVPALNRTERRRANEILARPTDKSDRGYFGKESPASPVCSDHFCIHFTDGKRNAPASDAFLQEVIDSTELTYAIENGDDALNWKDAKSDGKIGSRKGAGGEGQVDVYITDLGSELYGYAAPDQGQKGAQRFAYLVLDNNYVNFPSPPIESLKVTVAHEYNHILQFGYDTLEDLWMFESTATWAEQQVYPDINDYLNYLPSFAKNPQSPLTGRDKIYGEAVWNHWLSARYGVDVVRDAWADSLAVKPPHLATAAYERAIENVGGGSFSREFASFANATAEWNLNPSFPDAALYPDMKRRLKIGAKGTPIFLDNTSYALADVPTGGSAPIKLVVKAKKGTRSSIALIGRSGAIDTGTVVEATKYLGKGGRATVVLNEPGTFDRITAVVANVDGRPGARGYLNDGSKYSVKLGR